MDVNALELQKSVQSVWQSRCDASNLKAARDVFYVTCVGVSSATLHSIPILPMLANFTSATRHHFRTYILIEYTGSVSSQYNLVLNL